MRKNLSILVAMLICTACAKESKKPAVHGVKTPVSISDPVSCGCIDDINGELTGHYSFQDGKHRILRCGGQTDETTAPPTYTGFTLINCETNTRIDYWGTDYSYFVEI